ncbi:MAG TPA: patatin-like phospholipase family protein [Thermoanaerobaculia bacterium]|nr:patatin-like phospholipase family protein [Thermoanaerobaculia bacterium]
MSTARFTILAFAGALIGASLLSDMDWWPDRIFVFLIITILTAIAFFQRKQPILQYLYFCRFPLSIGFLLASLPFVCLSSNANALLGNLFVTRSGGIFLISMLAFLTAWVVLITSRMVARGVAARFGVGWPLMQAGPRDAVPQLGISAVLALPTICGIVYYRDPSTTLFAALSAATLGLICATALFYFADLLGRYLTVGNSGDWWCSLPIPKKLANWLDSKKVAWAALGRQKFEMWLSGQHPDIRAGYLDSKNNLLSGVALATGFFACTFATYSACYFLLHPQDGLALKVPALSYVLLLFILLAWILTALSYFFDRFRVPILTMLAILSFLLYFVDDIDHYYALNNFTVEGASTSAQATTLPPSGSPEKAQSQEIRKVLESRKEHWIQGREPVLVAVAASGGGIAASMWTAKVLAELQLEFGPDFSKSIYGLSTVSGGSVGAMYFIDAFKDGNPPSDRNLDRMIENASASSLSAIAWGFAYPDFWRGFSLQNPFRPLLDRAWAMEEVWKRRLRPGHPEDLPTLRKWGDETRAGRLPAALFNATIAETGERLVLSPLYLNPLPDSCAMDAWGCEDSVDAKTFYNLYKEKDLLVTTAARLSAAFPFVSPISRAQLGNNEGSGYHVADGGYNDNFGVLTLVNGLHHILEMKKAERNLAPAKILIIEIRASDLGKTKDAMPRRGWVYGTAGPMLTLLQVRNRSQISRNNLELDLLEELGKSLGFEIKRAVFPLMEKAPLSWDLTEDQKGKIRSSWDWCAALEKSKVHVGLETIRNFLSDSSTDLTAWELPPRRHTRLPVEVDVKKAQELCLGPEQTVVNLKR